MLIKPDKLPSQTTSNLPISLLSAIMKPFERVVGKCLQEHLENNGFFSKSQSGSKSTNDHLFCLSQIIMECFNRGRHVIAAFLDVEKAYKNVWHNGFRYMQNPSHHQTNKSQFADDTGRWVIRKNTDLAAEYLQRDLDKLARWCAKWRIKLNPEKRKQKS